MDLRIGMEGGPTRAGRGVGTEVASDAVFVVAADVGSEGTWL